MKTEKPDETELMDAEDICYKLANYIQEKWPSATSEINTLKEAADILATHSMDDEEEKKQMRKPAPTTPKPPVSPGRIKAPPPPTRATKPKSSYKLTTLGSAGRGEKIILYGVTGIGKTTLAALLPNAAFVSLDGGADLIRHPVTNEKLKGINIDTFADVRGVLQSNEFNPVDNIIIDHTTELQHLALSYMFNNIKGPKGMTCKNLEDYGYHKGYRFWYDTMRLILSDCDRWVRQGKNVVLLAQSSIVRWTQAGSEDFVMEGPELYHDSKVSTLTAYMSWADHIFRIGYSNLMVEDGKAAPVKERAVFVHPDATFFAKSRTIPVEYDVVTFSEPSDSSIWRLVFGGD